MNASVRSRVSRVSSPLLTISEAARQLGVSRSTAFRAVKAGTFPIRVIRFGQTNYVHRRDIDSFLAGDASIGIK